MGLPKFPTKRNLLLIAVAAVACAGIGAYFAFSGGLNLRTALDQFLAWIRSIGPVAFFVGMAVLPAFGFPLLAFSLSAAPVFAPQLGLPTVAGLVVASIVANLALTYWLARYAFRPLLEGIVKRMGYGLPQVSVDDHVSLTVVVRVTPGPPFFVQSYLLGLTGVRFGVYMWISGVIAGAYSLAVVFFGDSLVNGRGKLALLAVSLLVAISVVVHWLRRKFSKRRTPNPEASATP